MRPTQCWRHDPLTDGQQDTNPLICVVGNQHLAKHADKAAPRAFRMMQYLDTDMTVRFPGGT
jgi:hypothetical protein